MVRMFGLLTVLGVLGVLAPGCVETDAISEETSEVSTPAATTNGCFQLTRPRIEYWSEFGPAPGTPAPMDPYKVCITQSDCSSVCEGFDVTPSVYSWRGIITCTRCN